MANPEHSARLKEGVTVWNRWRDNNPAVAVDLRNADLHKTILINANLRKSDLRGAMLFGAFLANANLSGADLSGAILTNATLRYADFKDADLTGVDLRGAILINSNFGGTNLSGADLAGARLQGTNLSNTNFIDTKGLDLCRHEGPSSMGIDTFFQSRGQIPENFLRGCGVPEPFITYARSLMGQAIEFYSCFISYSTKDQEFAERLHADLQANAVRCWFAPRDIGGGKKVHEQIDEAIRVYDRLLLIVSRNSMNSEWVKTEISKARKRELQERRQMLFPVRLVDFGTLRDWECFDSDNGKDSAREIREYFIPDFSNWKDHDEYKNSFDRLLRDLKSERLK